MGEGSRGVSSVMYCNTSTANTHTPTPSPTPGVWRPGGGRHTGGTRYVPGWGSTSHQVQAGGTAASSWGGRWSELESVLEPLRRLAQLAPSGCLGGMEGRGQLSGPKGVNRLREPALESGSLLWACPVALCAGRGFAPGLPCDSSQTRDSRERTPGLGSQLSDPACTDAHCDRDRGSARGRQEHRPEVPERGRRIWPCLLTSPSPAYPNRAVSVSACSNFGGDVGALLGLNPRITANPQRGISKLPF